MELLENGAVGRILDGIFIKVLAVLPREISDHISAVRRLHRVKNICAL